MYQYLLQRITVYFAPDDFIIFLSTNFSTFTPLISESAAGDSGNLRTKKTNLNFFFYFLSSFLIQHLTFFSFKKTYLSSNPDLRLDTG